METERLSYGGGVAHVAEAFSLMVQTVLVAEKSICWLLFLIGSIPNNDDALSNLVDAEKRFPLSDLNKVASPDAECKDASETEDDSDDDEDAAVGEDSDNDAEDSSGEDNDDEEADPDSDSDANEDGEDDDDDDDDEDDDDDDDEDDDEDEEEDEEEENQPPFKKKK
ncbi:hypothetical protein Lser_V15G01250 [Lactuca serriola]